ncbi:hypothetical protein PG984_016513 [Apiospora sp. TS-2023a]
MWFKHFARKPDHLQAKSLWEKLVVKGGGKVEPAMVEKFNNLAPVANQVMLILNTEIDLDIDRRDKEAKLAMREIWEKCHFEANPEVEALDGYRSLSTRPGDGQWKTNLPLIWKPLLATFFTHCREFHSHKTAQYTNNIDLKLEYLDKIAKRIGNVLRWIPRAEDYSIETYPERYKEFIKDRYHLIWSDFLPYGEQLDNNPANDPLKNSTHDFYVRLFKETRNLLG